MFWEEIDSFEVSVARIYDSSYFKVFIQSQPIAE